MKAASSVLVMSQRPMTFLGIAPTLLGLVGAAAAIGIAIAILTDMIALLLPLMVLFGGTAWAWFWRAMRQDPHFDRRLFLSTAFWRGKHHRALLTGTGR